ncbi:M20/M25/M40 family metallo-hydrolase [Serratia ureilytica]
MHACGHDGHTAMLLAAARCLARQPNFSGTLHLIFQPAEEGGGGARVMIEDGLFERFPATRCSPCTTCPASPPATWLRQRPLDVLGRYGAHHPARPRRPRRGAAKHRRSGGGLRGHRHEPANHRGAQYRSAGNGDRHRGAMQAGQAANVIPATATLTLSVRALTAVVRARLEQRITELVTAQAASFGARAEIDYRHGYPVLVNHPAETELARAVALDWAGESRLSPRCGHLPPAKISPLCWRSAGSYISIGNGPATPGNSLHNPGYDFNDDNLSIGATYWVKLVERFWLAPLFNRQR